MRVHRQRHFPIRINQTLLNRSEKGSMANPVNLIVKGLKAAGGRSFLRIAGWAGVALTIGEIGWFAAKKGKILERLTHYYCEEGPVTCGKMIPDELIEESITEKGPGISRIEVKCPNCPQGKKTVRLNEWRKMKEQRKKWS